MVVEVADRQVLTQADQADLVEAVLVLIGQELRLRVIQV
jgi:hypothetical protein